MTTPDPRERLAAVLPDWGRTAALLDRLRELADGLREGVTVAYHAHHHERLPAVGFHLARVHELAKQIAAAIVPPPAEGSPDAT